MENMKIKIPYGMVRTITIICLTPFLMLMNSNPIVFAMWSIIVIFLITGNRPYWLYIISKTLCRDLQIVKTYLTIFSKMKKYEKQNMTVPKLFIQHAQTQPYKIAFFTEKRSWNYHEILELSLKSSHMFKQCGVQRGDVVGLILGNGGGAEMPAFWIGLSIIGSIGALIPPQIKGKALVHSILTAKAKKILFSEHFIKVIRDIRNYSELEGIEFFQYNTEDENVPVLENSISVISQLKVMPATLLNDELAMGNINDEFIYIYTSGTTGLPKAAIIKHSRYFLISFGTDASLNLNRNDVIYTPLPLHHTAGSCIGVGLVLVHGLTVAIRGKFSASNYWKDCIKYKCTIAQYIGEMCRFLLIAAEKLGESDSAKSHYIRAMIGNGLKYNIWKRFQILFKIPKICEIYGSTEGNTLSANLDGTVGAVGSCPRILGSFSPNAIIKCDEITGEPVRINGYCIRCKPGEPGLIIGKVNKKKVLYTFTGYVDKEATLKKTLHDVFKKGDIYFNSGDILVMDHFGYYYFNDRIGDTFRWRGENVSTTEVETILSSIFKLTDIVVYGVQVPHVEGKAGMAAIMGTEKKLDLKAIKEKMNDALPLFAHPIFIRIIPNTDMTPTFKIIKRNLQIEGFDIKKITDPLYFLDPMTSKYVPLSPILYEEILNGNVKL